MGQNSWNQWYACIIFNFMKAFQAFIWNKIKSIQVTLMLTWDWCKMLNANVYLLIIHHSFFHNHTRFCNMSFTTYLLITQYKENWYGEYAKETTPPLGWKMSDVCYFFKGCRKGVVKKKNKLTLSMIWKKNTGLNYMKFYI